MSMTRNSRVGLLVLIVSTLALGWSLAGKPNPFSHPPTIHVELRDASTLIHFDRDVRLSGAIVGKVGDVRRRGDLAVLTLHLSDDARKALHTDATAELRPHTLFDGNSFVELHPGSASAPRLGDGTIRVARTTNYVSLDKALRVMRPGTRRSLQQLLHGLRTSIGPRESGALRRTFRTVPSLMTAQGQWARAAQGPSRHELSGAIAGFAKTTDAIARARDDIGPSLQDLGPTATSFQGTQDALGRTLAVLPASLEAMRASSTALEPTLRQARAWAVDTTPGLRALSPTLTELRPVVRDSIPALRQARPLAAALRGTLARVRVAAPPAVRLLKALGPVFQQAADDLIPYLSTRTATGTSVIEGLLYTTSSATSMLSPVKSIADGETTGSSGPGHGQYSHSNSDGSEIGCGQVPDAVAAVMKEAQLCVP